MKKRFLSLFLVTVMVLSTLAVFPVTVSAADTWGEGNNVISTLADLQAFEAAVEGGNNFSGATVTLAADITLPSDWNGIGARTDKPFNGIFDGQGYTITMSGHRETGTSTGAIFNMVNGATVKNFRVVGSMTLTQTTSFSAPVIGCAQGNVTVQDVHCSVNITGDGRIVYAGGIVGVLHNYANATILFDGCIFDGTMTFKNGASEIGAFLGYTGNMSASDTKKVTIKNCVYAGTMTFRYNLEAKWNGCFVGFAKSGVSGATVYVEVRDSISVGTMKFENENAFSNQNNGIVVGDYSSTGNTNIIISNFYYLDITDAAGTGVLGVVYANGRSYSTDGGVVKLVTPSTAAALTANDFSNDTRLAFKGAAGGYAYYPCPTAFADSDNWPASLTIEQEADKFSDNPVINTVEDMLAFETELEAGNNFAGTEVLLNADIVLPATWDGIGARSDKPFKGTFNGQGHTITLSGHSQAADTTAAIFNMVDGATIKDLNLAGSMNLKGNFGGVLIACAQGNVTIKNVRNSVNVGSAGNVSYAGGFVGFLNNNVTTDIVFDGCVFDGVMNFANQTNDIGGFLGYTGHVNGTNYKKHVTIQNSVFAGTMMFNDANYSTYSGGFVGYVLAGTGSSVTTVKDCISIGKMTYSKEISQCVNGVVCGRSTGTLNVENVYYFDMFSSKGDILTVAGSGTPTISGTVKAVTSAEMAALTVAAFSNDATMTTRAADVDVYYPCPAGLIKDGAWVSSLMIVNDARVLGAQIRYLDDADLYTGIRFVAKFKADAEGVANAGSADATFGVILISKANYEALESKTFEALSAAGVKVNAIKATTEDGIVTVKAVIYNIDVANYTDEIVAIPYIGTALAGDGVARSIYSVAQDCVADANATAAAKTFAQEVIDVVEG